MAFADFLGTAEVAAMTGPGAAVEVKIIGPTTGAVLLNVQLYLPAGVRLGVARAVLGLGLKGRELAELEVEVKNLPDAELGIF